MVRLNESLIDEYQYVYEWYYKKFNRKLNIPQNLTFDDVIQELYYGSSIYRALGIHNKEICSNVIYGIADILGIKYIDAMCYFVWHDAPDEFIPSNVNYQTYVDKFNQTMARILDNYMYSR